MASLSSRKRQRCSYCRKTGHNKRVCPILHPEKYEQPRASHNGTSSTVDLSISKKQHFSPMVDIHVTKKPEVSSHVVNLRAEGYEKEWDAVTPYVPEKAPQLPQCASYNPAEAVSFSNKVAKVNAYLSAVKAYTKQDQAVPRADRMKEKPVVIRQPLVSRIGSSFSFPRPSFSFFSRAKDWWYGVLNAKYMRYVAVILLFFSILPFPALSMYIHVRKTGDEVINASTNAFLSLQSSTAAAFHANLPQAQYDLEEALASFDTATNLVDKEHKLLISTAKLLPIIGAEVKSRQAVLEAGHKLALWNTYLVKGIEEASKDDSMSIIDRFRILRVHIDRSIPQYQEALVLLNKVNPSTLPLEYQEPFVQFRDLFAAVIDDMHDIVQLVDAVDLVFGGKHPRTHLIMFQNTNEWRPTGGFTGSFAVVNFSDGKWDIDVPGGGTYDLQGQLDVFEKPPLPLQLVNKRWEFQDANWFPDFSASAQKTAWFYEHARGETVDGVIAIDSTVLERFLRVVGPQVSRAYDDVSLDADSAVHSIEEQIVSEKDSSAPKQIVSSLLLQFLTDVQSLDAGDMLGLLQELHEALEQGEIKVYFSDESQSYFRQFGWTGELVATAPAQDYLHVSVANIGGAKTDALIEQNIDHQSVIQEDGSIIDTVIIHRAQDAYYGDNTLYNTSNISYIRAYVPEGAELLDAGGFTPPPEDFFVVPEDWYVDDVDVLKQEQGLHIDEHTGTRITNEFEKTAFGNWMITSPGESQSLYFVYKLPFSLFDMSTKQEDTWADLLYNETPASKYSLLTQKQSGKDVHFSSQIIYPNSWQPVWKSRPDIDFASNGATFDTTLLVDEVYGVVFAQHK